MSDLRLRVILDAMDRASGPFKRIAGGAGALGKSIRETNNTLKALQAQQGQLGSFRKIKSATEQSGNAYQAARQKAAQLRAGLEAMEAPTRAQARAVTLADRAAAKLQKTHTGNLRALRDQRRALTDAGIGAKQFGQHEKRLAEEIEATSAAMKRQQARLGAMQKARARADSWNRGGAKAAAVGAGMAYAGQRALRGAMAPAGAAMQFESAMADVRKVVDFDTPDQFRQMGRDIQDLSMRLPMTSDGIAQIVAAAGQANIARGDLLRFAEDAAKMGVAFDTTAEEAGETMATWRTAFRMTQDEVVGLADQVNYLGNTGPASVGKISEVLTRVGALGEVGGLASGQVAALGATIAGMGIGSEVAGTGIKNLILRLTAGTSATKKQQAVFKKLKLDAVGMAQAMQDDAGGAILTVLRRLRELPAAQQNAAMAQLFGTESIGAIAPLLTNLELLEGNLAKVADAQLYGGSMEAEYASRVATSENSLQLLKNTLQVVAETLGTLMLPAVNEISGKIQQVAERVVTWSRDNPELASTLVKIALGGAAVVTVLGGLLVAGGTAAIMLGNIMSVTTMLTGGHGILGLVKMLGGLAGKAIPLVLTGIRALSMALLTTPIGWVILIVSAIAGVAYLVWKHWDTITAAFRIGWEWIKVYAGHLWKVITGLFSGDMAQVVAGLSKMWEMINGLLGGWPAKFVQWGADMIMGLIRGIGSMAGALKDSVVGAVSGAVDKFKSFLGIKSPSRLFAQFGSFSMQGLADGLDRGARAPIAAVEAVAGGMKRAGAAAVVGMAALPAAAIDHRPPVSAGAAPAAVAPVYNITIHAGAGGPAAGQEIAALVRAEIERIHRENAARSRSALSDYGE